MISAYNTMASGRPMDDGHQLPINNVNTMEEMIRFVYESDISLPSVLKTANCFIFTSNRMAASQINDEVLAHVNGRSSTYLAKDTLGDPSPNELPYPTATGRLASQLNLKIGSRVQLVCNYDGLVAGQNCVVVSLNEVDIFVRPIISDGTALAELGTYVKISPINSTVSVPGQNGILLLNRLQLPVCLAYATTFWAGQGRTLDRIGIDMSQHQSFARGEPDIHLMAALYQLTRRAEHSCCFFPCPPTVAATEQQQQPTAEDTVEDANSANLESVALMKEQSALGQEGTADW